MSLDWANERYVRAYTRDTAEMLCWPWESRAIWWLLVRKADRSGLIPTKLGLRGLAALIAMPIEVVSAGVAGLLEDGCFREVPGGYLIPNYIEAQETPASDAKRQRDLRERRREGATSENNKESSHDESHVVADRHATSRDVTPSRTYPIRSEPCLAEPSQAEPKEEREPSPTARGSGLTSVPALSLVAQEPTPKAPRKAPSLPLPADWAPSPAHVALAHQLAVSVTVEADKLRDWAASKGERKVNWDSAFSNWLRRAGEARAGPGRGGGGRPPWQPTTAGSELPRLLEDIERMERES